MSLNKLTASQGETLLEGLKNKLNTVKAKANPTSYQLTGDPVIDKTIRTKFQASITSQIGEVVNYVQEGKLTTEEGRTLINSLNAKRGSLSGGGGSGGSKKGKVNYKGVKIPKATYKISKPLKLKLPKSHISKYKPVKTNPIKYR